MLKPEIGQLINENDAIYGLVVAVAKRARDIADKAEEEDLDLGVPDVELHAGVELDLDRTADVR